MFVSTTAITMATASGTSTTKKNRCACCNKKLGLVMFTCKCGGNYCGDHRINEAHNCTYDYHQEYKQTLIIQLPKITGIKIDKI